MGGVAIVTDSTADFSEVRVDGLPMTIVPLTVNWGRDVLRDRIDISTTDFYTRLRTDPELPRTAAPPLGIFEEVYRNLLSQYASVVSLHLASTLSATYSVAVMAARSVDAERIHVVDSTTISVGLGWLSGQAAALARDGSSAEQILEAVHGTIPRVRIYVALETLEYLQRGGRIGRAQAFVGGLLGVKPILEVKDGAVLPFERVRTRSASIRRLAELVKSAGRKKHVAVAHGDAVIEAHSLRQSIMDAEHLDNVSVTEIGAVIGAHAGPGLIGVGFILAD